MEYFVYTYKVHLTQYWKPTDHRLRRKYVFFVLELLVTNVDYSNNNFFNVEPYSVLYCRIRGMENPQVIHEKQI